MTHEYLSYIILDVSKNLLSRLFYYIDIITSFSLLIIIITYKVKKKNRLQKKKKKNTPRMFIQIEIFFTERRHKDSFHWLYKLNIRVSHFPLLIKPDNRNMHPMIHKFDPRRRISKRVAWRDTKLFQWARKHRVQYSSSNFEKREAKSARTKGGTITDP